MNVNICNIYYIIFFFPKTDNTAKNIGQEQAAWWHLVVWGKVFSTNPSDLLSGVHSLQDPPASEKNLENYQGAIQYKQHVVRALFIFLERYVYIELLEIK